MSNQRSRERTAMMPVKLREWRAHVGLSQMELAEKSGVGHATISRLESTDKVQAAQPGTRRQLAEALGITPIDIIGLPPGFEAVAPETAPGSKNSPSRDEAGAARVG